MPETEANPAADATATLDERLAYRGLGQRMLLRPEIVGILFAIVMYICFWGVARPFGNAAGAATVLDVSATLGIMAVAVAVLMIGGEFDLSSGAMTGAMGIVIILLVKEAGDIGGAGFNYWVAIPLSLAIALAIGWVNGTLVDRTGMPSFIVTLATFFVLRGLKLGGSKILVDQIQVGRADEGAGYAFWNRIFGSEWVRGEHIWGGRDATYVLLTVIGGVLVALAVFEFAFARKEKLHPAGLVLLLAGLAGGGLGVFLMHELDGTDWLPAVVLAGAALVAAFGLAIWRYKPLESVGELHFPAPLVRSVGIAAALVVVAVVAALVFDSGRDDDLIFPLTHQGARAIIFILAIGAAAIVLIAALLRSSELSPKSKSLLLLVIAAVTFGMALFVQAESESEKFRSQLFTGVCLAALFMAVWALVSMRFEIRRTVDANADRTAKIVMGAGMALAFVGIAVRVLFAVQSEIDNGDPTRLAKFSVRILWFVGFALVMSWVLRRTKFGSWVFAVGGNKDAARQIGVPAARTKVQLFMLVAFAAWLVGLLLAFRLNTIQAGTGNGEEFEYIIAAVVGGTLLTGGYGSVFGAVIGALIMAMAQQGISFAGWNTDWRFLFLGIILLVSVYANGRVRKLAEAAR